MEMTHIHDEKTSVFAVREAMYIFGTILGASLPLMLEFVIGDTEDDVASK